MYSFLYPFHLFSTTTGPANSGEFYRIKNLLLQESTSSPSGATNWVVGQPGLTCAQVCNEDGRVCNSAAMQTGLQSKEQFQTAVTGVYPCNDPLMLECNSLSTTEHMSNGRCYYSSNQQCTNDPGAEEVDPCATNTITERRRFCACKSVRRMLKSSPRATLTASKNTQAQNTVAEDEATSARHRKAFQQEVDDAWVVGSSTVHGTSAAENLPPPHQNFLYNPLTGAIVRNERNVENLKINRVTGPATDETVTKSQTTKNAQESQPERQPERQPEHSPEHSPEHPPESQPHHWQQPPLASAASRPTSTSLLWLTSILCLFFMISEVDAHNWMGTPVRGFNIGDIPSVGGGLGSATCETRRPTVSTLKHHVIFKQSNTLSIDDHLLHALKH